MGGKKKICPNSSLASPLHVDYMAALGIKEVPCVDESPEEKGDWLGEGDCKQGMVESR